MPQLSNFIASVFIHVTGILISHPLSWFPCVNSSKWETCRQDTARVTTQLRRVTVQCWNSAGIQLATPAEVPFPSLWKKVIKPTTFPHTHSRAPTLRGGSSTVIKPLDPRSPEGSTNAPNRGGGRPMNFLWWGNHFTSEETLGNLTFLMF